MQKIALPVDKERVHVQLEKAAAFRIFEVEGRTICGSILAEVTEPLVGQLHCLGVRAVLCGMLSPELRRDLAMAGIVVFAGVYGVAEEVLQQLLDGILNCEPDTLRSVHSAHYSPCRHSGEF